MQMKDGRGRDGGVGEFLFTVQRGGRKHTETHEGSGIFDLDTDLCGAKGGVEDSADVADCASDDAVRVGVEADIGGLAEVYVSEVVFVDVADDPDVGEIGDGEGGG
jgi:hypothetical protein